MFTRTGSTWTQQGGKLTGTGETGAGGFGVGVALSADGSTALIGGADDRGASGRGGLGVHARSGSTWTPQGGKLTGTGEDRHARQVRRKRRTVGRRRHGARRRLLR